MELLRSGFDPPRRHTAAWIWPVALLVRAPITIERPLHSRDNARLQGLTLRTYPGIVAWAACSLAALLGAATFAMFLPLATTTASGGIAQFQQALAAMVAVPYALVGALIVWQRPRHKIGWLMVALGLAGGLAVFGAGYARTGLPAADALGVVGDLGWVLAIALVVLLIALFPTSQPPSPAWRPLVWLTVAWTLAAIVWALMFGRQGAPPTILLAAIGGCAVAAVASQLVRFLRSTGVERQQLKWFAYAAFVFLVLVALGISRVLGIDWSATVATAALYVLPVGIAVAILRHRLYDIDALISRTFVYGSLTAILAGLYTASIRLFNALFVGATGERSEEALVITTLILAATFTPIKRRLEGLVERRFRGPAEAPSSAGSGSDPDRELWVELAELSDRLARLEGMLTSPSTDRSVLQSGRRRIRGERRASRSDSH